MPGSKRRRVWAQSDDRRVRIPAPEPRATPPPPAAAPPLRPPLPPARAAASSEDALVKGRGGADGCRAQSMAMADLRVQEQLHDVPDAEVGESSEMDTPFRGGAMPSVSQTGSGKAALLGKESINKARALLQDVYSAAGAVQPIFRTGMGRPVPVSRISIDKARAVLEGQTVAGKEDKEKSTHLRFLVSNTAAGCIFGKGGSTINDFQSLSGAHIQFSCSHEFLPGTNDRIIMVSGLFDEVVKAMQLVLERLLSEGGESNEAEARPEFKLLVPNSSCGGIIGKGGATIKSFIEDSHAGIKISPEDNNSVDLHDMLVTITGSLSSQMRAIYLILSKLSEDVHYPPNLSSPFPYAGLGFPSYPAAVPARYMIPQVPYNDAVNYGPNGYAGDGGGRYQNKKPAATMAAAPPPTLPDDLIKEILLRLPPDDPASLLNASLVCKTWSHIAKVQLKCAQLQLQLETALQLENALQLKCALLQLQLQLKKDQLMVTQLEEELNQLLQRRSASSSSRAASSRRRSASSSSRAPSSRRRSASSSSRAPSSRRRSASSRGQPAAAQARPAWR